MRCKNFSVTTIFLLVNCFIFFSFYYSYSYFYLLVTIIVTVNFYIIF